MTRRLAHSQRKPLFMACTSCHSSCSTDTANAAHRSHVAATLGLGTLTLVLHDERFLQWKAPGVYALLALIFFGSQFVGDKPLIERIMGHAISLMKDERTVMMLQSAIIPFGPLGRAIFKATDGRKYARGNSSVLVFHPRHCTFIAERFRQVHARHPDFNFPPMIADERFISWCAQPHMARIPKSFAVKFPNEFMFPRAGWLYLKAALPWVRSRREGLTAITLCGLDIKPEKLLALQDAEVIEDNKARKLVWSVRAMGSAKQKIIDFYRPILSILT